MRPIVSDDLLDERVVADPYSYFGAIREKGPIVWNETYGGWVVTSYDAVSNALKDRRLSADTITPYVKSSSGSEEMSKWGPLFDTLSRWIVFMDPPDHTRIRGLLNKAFTPRVIEALRPQVRALARELLDDVRDRDEFDIVADFAFPLPANVISLMLGARIEDLDRIQEWSRSAVLVSLGDVSTPDRRQRAQTALIEFREYFDQILQERKGKPLPDDLLSQMLAAREAGHQLSPDDIVASAMLLLIAGHETTQSLIANTMVALNHWPDQRQLIMQDHAMLSGAVEEALRYDGPVKATVRHVSGPTELAGQALAPGEKVLLVFSSANRDPDQFDKPDRFDVRRGRSDHLGFGRGIHFCLGASLARMETQEALSSLLEAAVDFEMDIPGITYQRKLFSRAPERVRMVAT